MLDCVKVLPLFRLWLSADIYTHLSIPDNVTYKHIIYVCLSMIEVLLFSNRHRFTLLPKLPSCHRAARLSTYKVRISPLFALFIHCLKGNDERALHIHMVRDTPMHTQDINSVVSLLDRVCDAGPTLTSSLPYMTEISVVIRQ